MVRSSFLAALLLLALVPAAHAGSASVADGRVHFDAAAGEANDVRLARVAEGLQLTDAGAGLTAGEGCAQKSPRRVVCAGEGLVAQCGDGSDEIEDPDAQTFVDRSCERVGFGGHLTVRSHPVKVTARSATFRVRCPRRDVDDFGESSPCQGSVFVKSAAPGGKRYGVRGFSGESGRTRLVTVPLSSRPAGAVVVGIEIAADPAIVEPAQHLRWLLQLAP